MRFIYPATPLLVIVTGLGLAEILAIAARQFTWTVSSTRI
ncbi:MAG: hypothetical protein JWN07_2504, partial [Hyphomicrobiales bacterium]|nr:hypothetical protein [Hyphomicrobiales bacterium]